MDKILLFIPMYNCENQIIRVLNQIDDTILNYISEVIVVNNKSIDNGESVVIDYCRKHDELPLKLLRNDENYGLGGSHKVAFEYAIDNSFDYVIVLHGDDQGAICDLLPALKTKSYRKYDCYLGARFASESKLIGYSKIRIVGNLFFNFIFSMAMRRKIFDLGAGLNMYSVDILKSRYYYTYPDNLTFNVYMLMAVKSYNQSYAFFPLTWRETDQVSNAKVLSQAIKTLKMLVKYTINEKDFLKIDYRDKKYNKYTYQIVYGGIK